MSDSLSNYVRKRKIANKSTWTSVVVNFFLVIFQIVVGLFSKSSGLIADGFHILADMFSDLIVLITSKKSLNPPDDDHNYGHHRYENAVGLFLGVLLLFVGCAMIWSAGKKLENSDQIVAVHVTALYASIICLVIKELLFRYLLNVAKRAKEAALREREEALNFARRLFDENKRLQDNLGGHTRLLVDTAKQNAALSLEDAKRRYKAAYEAGDADQLVAAQEELTQAKIRLDKVENFQPPPLQPPPSPVQSQPQPAPERSPDPKALAWRNQNRWFGQDEEMTSFALGLHEKLVKNGVDPTSEEYYDRINSRIREKFPENFEAPAKKASSVVAPASRSVAPKKITLTQTQVALAKKLGVPLELYARKVAEGMVNG